MKYVLYYWSRFGHNKKIVEYLGTKLKDKSKEIDIINVEEADPTKVPNADFYVFSAPAEAFNVQRNMRKFMKKLSSMDDKKYAIINTHGMNRNWLKKMDKYLKNTNMEKVAEADLIVKGDGQKEGNALPDDWKEKIDDFSSKL